MSKDPIGLNGGVNRFVYANASPQDAIDPVGEAPDGIGSYWDRHAQNVHNNTRTQNATLAGAMVGAAALGLFALEGLPWLYAGAEVDGAWAALPLRQKLLYEIGQKTLSRAAFEGLAKSGASGPCEAAIARGAQLVASQGWWRAIAPSIGGEWSATMGTGATPAARAAFEALTAFLAGAGVGAATSSGGK